MQKKRFHFFRVTEAQDQTRKVHPAMYILLQTCHFRHLSKYIWNMESNPTELLLGIAHWHIYVCKMYQIRGPTRTVLFPFCPCLSEWSLEIFSKNGNKRNRKCILPIFPLKLKKKKAKRNLENNLGYHVEKDWNKWPMCYNIKIRIRMPEAGFHDQLLTLHATNFQEVKSY